VFIRVAVTPLRYVYHRRSVSYISLKSVSCRHDCSVDITFARFLCFAYLRLQLTAVIFDHTLSNYQLMHVS